MLSVKQAAELLCLSRQTVYILCTLKRIRHERHGVGRGKILIPVDAIEEYRRRCTVGVEEESVPPPKKEIILKHLRLPS